jgi:hypothetical protein
MLFNTYYFFFTLLFKFLSRFPKTGIWDNTEQEFVYKISTVLWLIFVVPYFLISLSLLKMGVRIIKLPNLPIPSIVIGLIITALFYFINYLLLGRRDRYKVIIERYKSVPLLNKIVHYSIIISYNLIALVLWIFF